MRVRCYCFTFALALLAAFAFSNPAAAGPISAFAQTNLVSSVPNLAPGLPDPDLKNPWGISFGSTPFWVSDQVTGVATIYNGAGVKQGLVVSMPNPQLPTGTVFNGSTPAFNSDLFLFATLNGTIDGWRGALGTTAESLFPGAAGSVYTGLTLATSGGTPRLYAANASLNRIDVYDTNGNNNLTGNFTDSGIPTGFTPYNVETIGNSIFVTYSQRDMPGGFVSEFDLNGTFIRRFASDDVLDEPWGLVVAPGTFGPVAGALLIGNEGDGHINAFNLLTGALIGTLADQSGNPLTNTGLWALKFGNGSAGFSPNSLYFTAGINDENDGLFARIDAVPEPGTFSLLALAALAAVLLRKVPQFRR
jgi:uncharacterized protein (TIGR03118 family)